MEIIHELEVIHHMAWQFNKIWVERGDSSNYVDCLPNKQALMRALRAHPGVVKSIEYNSDRNVTIYLVDTKSFEIFNVYCNTLDEKVLSVIETLSTNNAVVEVANILHDGIMNKIEHAIKTKNINKIDKLQGIVDYYSKVYNAGAECLRNELAELKALI